MAVIMNVADIRDPNDPQGRTYRQINAAKTHAIPIGSLVEVNVPGDHSSGIRLFVVHHGRDCDQTPLYYLSHDPNDTEQERPGRLNRSWAMVGGCSEQYLVVIRPAANLPDSTNL